MALTTSIIDHLGEEAEPIATTIDAIWADIQASAKPGETGAVLIQKLMEILDNPSQFREVAHRLGLEVPAGFEEGSSGLLSTVNNTTSSAVAEILGAKPQFLSAGGEITDSLAQGATQGAEKMHPAATHALNKYLLPIQSSTEPMATGTKVGTDTATGVETGVAPVEGIFSTAFTAASIATVGIMSSLLADITLSAEYMRDNVTNSFNTLKDNMVTHLNTAGTAVTGFQGKSSTLSTTIASHTKSMSSNISSFASSAVNNFGKVGSAAASAASGVNKLQSAINSLKDKTVTITVRYKTVGSPGGAQHGGSFIIDKPDRVAGVRVAETFPELATITPLDPKEPNSPFHNVDADLKIPAGMNNATSPSIPSLEGLTTAGGGSGAGTSNVTVTGNIYLTNQLANGEVLSKAVKPFLLKGYSAIVS